MARDTHGVGRLAVRSNMRLLPLAAGTAFTLGSLAGPAFGQAFNWVASTGNFSSGANWQGSIAPPLSDPATALTFTSGNAPAITVTNNIGTPFVVNLLSFNVNNAFTLRSFSTSYMFQLAGAAPAIGMSGLGTATMVTGGAIQLTSDLNINVAGPGSLILNDVISDDSGTGGAQRALTISGGNPVRGWRLVGLGAANSFWGLTLDGGAVTTTEANPTTFGAASSTLTVTPNGGLIAPTGTMSPSLGALQLNGDLYLVGQGSLTLAGGVLLFPTVVQGSGTLNVNFATAGLTLESDSSAYTGAVAIDQSQLPNMGTFPAGTLTLGGVRLQTSFPNGSLRAVPSFDVRAGGQLLLTSNVDNSLQNGDKVGDTTPVRLRSGSLTLNGPAVEGSFGFTPTNLTEAIGALSGAGNCTITVASTATTNVITTLQADSIVRLERGTFIFRGPALGDSAQSERGRVTLANPLAGSAFVGGGGTPGSQNVSILPYAAGGTTISDNGTSLVTYGADGFRPLATTEYYSTDLAPSDPTVNVRLTGATANNTARTMNALLLANDGASVDASVTGSGTLNITSGVIIANPQNATNNTPIGLSNNIAFGSAEGIIYTVGTGGLKITGNLTGSNGLTRTGNGPSTPINNTDVLVLTGDNHLLTGPLTIDAGILEFNSGNALPGTGPIVANGSNVSVNFVVNASGPGAGLAYVGSSPLTISRGITVNTGYLSVKQLEFTGPQLAIGNLTLAGQITGTGGMDFHAQNAATPSGEIFVTNTANTYTGPTRFGGGTTHIAGDGSTGVGGGWDFASSAALTLEGSVANSRHVNLEGATTINTNGHDMTLSGPITGLSAGSLSTGNGGFTKTGAGTLTLASPINLLPGAIAVNAGMLIVDGNVGPSPTSPLTVASGATLGGSGTVWRNTTVNGTLSPGNGPGVLTIGGNLTFGSGSTLSMQINGPGAGTGYDQVVANSASGGVTVALGAGVANLSLSLGFAPAAHSAFWLISNTSRVANSTTGNFAGLPEGSTITVGTFGGATYSGFISYTGNFATGQADGTGNDVVIFDVHATRSCGSADFNCDGDIGTDADIEAFFACLSGACPGLPCTNNADFNGDGDVGTDADIESFFRVLGGGHC